MNIDPIINNAEYSPYLVLPPFHCMYPETDNNNNNNNNNSKNKTNNRVGPSPNFVAFLNNGNDQTTGGPQIFNHSSQFLSPQTHNTPFLNHQNLLYSDDDLQYLIISSPPTTFQNIKRTNYNDKNPPTMTNKNFSNTLYDDSLIFNHLADIQQQTLSYPIHYTSNNNTTATPHFSTTSINDGSLQRNMPLTYVPITSQPHSFQQDHTLSAFNIFNFPKNNVIPTITNNTTTNDTNNNDKHTNNTYNNNTNINNTYNNNTNINNTYNNNTSNSNITKTTNIEQYHKSPSTAANNNQLRIKEIKQNLMVDYNSDITKSDSDSTSSYESSINNTFPLDADSNNKATDNYYDSDHSNHFNKNYDSSNPYELPTGVRYDAIKKSFRAIMKTSSGKKIHKSFSTCKYGIETAKSLAIASRYPSQNKSEQSLDLFISNITIRIFKKLLEYKTTFTGVFSPFNIKCVFENPHLVQISVDCNAGHLATENYHLSVNTPNTPVVKQIAQKLSDYLSLVMQ